MITPTANSKFVTHKRWVKCARYLRRPSQQSVGGERWGERSPPRQWRLQWFMHETAASLIIAKQPSSLRSPFMFWGTVKFQVCIATHRLEFMNNAKENIHLYVNDVIFRLIKRFEYPLKVYQSLLLLERCSTWDW